MEENGRRTTVAVPAVFPQDNAPVLGASNNGTISDTQPSRFGVIRDKNTEPRWKNVDTRMPLSSPFPIQGWYHVRQGGEYDLLTADIYLQQKAAPDTAKTWCI